MRFLLIIATVLAVITSRAGEADTLRQLEIENVVVRSSTKETNKPWSTPGAISVVTPFKINQRGIVDIKDLSAVVPNFFIPEYGSKMTTPVYLRGVGARSSGQGVGMYVDNIPYMDKSTFDFELMDIQRIEVLRGPQGTLYGRNAMGGIINIYTISPFDYQGTKVMLSAGNYGYIGGKVSTYQKLSSKVAFSVAGYYDKQDGFYVNKNNNSKQDAGWNLGGKIKLEWKITDKLTASIASAYDYTDQNAFPYGLYKVEQNEVLDVDYNDRGTYLRNMSNNSLRLEYKTDQFMLTSNTGYQWLNDNMWMDQDFTPKDVFTINQRQLQNSINQEIVAKSVNDRNYQWSVGFFGFYNAMTTNSEVSFKKDGIKDIIGSQLPPFIKITDDVMPNPGIFKTPSYGLALFHQSTFNNILTRGLSVTLGIRLEYEHQYLDYNTSMAMHGTAQAPGMPRPMPFAIDTTMVGNDQQSYLRALPKVSIKYECTPNVMTYATVSRGYKAGGYNFQMFSEVIQSALKEKVRPGGGAKTPIKDLISYKPESVWNYEIGSRGEFFNGGLGYDFAIFYMDVKDLQLTQFVTGGSGRILTNAGRSSSCGVEVALNSSPVENLFLDATYGYTHSVFTEYNDGKVDYKGKFVPYVPQHTFSFGANYTFKLNSWFKGLTLGANYNGVGKIYWTEANDISQPFYGLLNAKATLRADILRIELWANNILNERYGAFYFESFGNHFVQQGRPFTFGASVAVTL